MSYIMDLYDFTMPQLPTNSFSAWLAPPVSITTIYVLTRFIVFYNVGYINFLTTCNHCSKLPAYFKACVYCEDYEAVQAAAPGIITIEPHDILPVSIFCFSSFVGFFPTHDMRGCLTSGCFAVPGDQTVLLV